MVEPLDPSSVRPGRVGRDLVILKAGAAETRHLRWKMLGGVACGIALAAALGFGGGLYLRAAPEPVPQQALLQKAEVAQLVAQGEARQSKEMRRLSDELRGLKSSLASLQASVDRGQQGTDVKALKASVEALRQNIDAVKSETGAAIGQLSGKVDRADQATAQKLVQIAERLDRLERSKPDPMPVGAIPPKPPTKPPGKPAPAKQSQDAAQPKPKVAEASPPKPAETVAPLPRPKTPIPGWVLREVYDGYALVEGRDGYQEVAIGQTLPGVGRVEAIERRGNRWVVVTSLGLIASDWN